jgi:Ni,Fe-hydrogenase III small subunit/ferredoxin
VIRWFLRGVSGRRLTTSYPRRDEEPPPAFRARALLDADAREVAQAQRFVEVCLPRALSLDERGRLQLDGSRCIGCGLCVAVAADGPVAIDQGYALAARTRGRLMVGTGAGAEEPARSLLGGVFRRSLHIRHIDTGSDGAIEQEIAALLGPHYDMHRLGLFFTASPRHADVLLVTGAVSAPMERPLKRTYDAMPEPRIVVAAGTDACSGSIWTEPEVRGGVDRVLPVDVYIPGDPPSPIALLHGLLLAAGRAREVPPPRNDRGDVLLDASAGGVRR